MGNSVSRRPGKKAKEVADVLRGRSRLIDAYALRAADGRLYFDFSEAVSIAALRDLFVFTDLAMAKTYQKMEVGSKIVRVKFRVDITVEKD